MSDGFDLKEFMRFEKNFLEGAQKRMPKETKAFLRKQAKKLRKITIARAEDSVDKQYTGNLLKGIKVGKVYTYRGNGGLSIRVYGGKPAYHIHLVNDGHKILDKDKKEIGFVDGKHFFEDAAADFSDVHQKDTYDFFDELIEKGL